MATLALSTMRDRLRIMLSDESSKTWKTDSTLDLFLNQAIVKLTTDVPIPSVTGYVIEDDQQADEHTYLLPDDFVTDYHVRGYFESSGEAENLVRRNYQPGAWDTNDEPRCYLIDWPSEGYLYLPRAPQSTTFNLYYGAYSSDWLSADEDVFDLRRHRWQEQAIYAYAAYLAFQPSSALRAQLEQWARRGDLNVGNPLEEEANRWLALYRQLLDEHGGAPVSWEFARSD